MALQIICYAEGWIPEVKAFNARLKAGGLSFRFPESPVPSWLPPLPGRSLFQEYYLAVADGRVRGGYILKHQEFMVNAEVLTIGNYQLPLSEGTIDNKYVLVALRLLGDALKRRPLLYSLGIGGMDKPLAKQLTAMGWSVHAVPFYARILHPSRFLRNISYLRKTAGRRLLLNLFALTGAGWLGVSLFNLLRLRHGARRTEVVAEQFGDFGNWSDRVWKLSNRQYVMSAVRDSATLNTLYPESDRRFLKLKICTGKQPVGWVVLLATHMSRHKYFGNMKLGSIVDCLALPGLEPAIIEAACERLRREDVDLIVSNQCHRAWCEALAVNGFFRGPSNFLLLVSRDLAAKLSPFGASVQQSHFNRGDGDGPIHL